MSEALLRRVAEVPGLRGAGSAADVEGAHGGSASAVRGQAGNRLPQAHCFRVDGMHRMKALQETLGDESPMGGRQRDYSPLYACVSTARRYEALLATGDELRAVWRDTETELTALAAEFGPDEPSRAMIDEALAVVGAADLNAAEVPPDLLEVLEALGHAFATADLEGALRTVRMRRRHDLLWEETLASIPDEATSGGRWQMVAEVAVGWRTGAASGEACRAFFEDLRCDFETLEREYEDSTWLTEEEWTVEVSLADELLSSGLSAWREGLAHLAHHCAEGAWGAAREDLVALREAHRCLLMVESLQQCAVNCS